MSARGIQDHYVLFCAGHICYGVPSWKRTSDSVMEARKESKMALGLPCRVNFQDPNY